MYYLMLKNTKRTHKIQQTTNLSEFKKKKKGSVVKLQPMYLC